MNLKNNMNYFVINKVQKNKTHNAVIEAILSSEIGKNILNTKIPLSTVKVLVLQLRKEK